jgi:hypothetical protein
MSLLTVEADRPFAPWPKIPDRASEKPAIDTPLRYRYGI